MPALPRSDWIECLPCRADGAAEDSGDNPVPLTPCTQTIGEESPREEYQDIRLRDPSLRYLRAPWDPTDNPSHLRSHPKYV